MILLKLVDLYNTASIRKNQGDKLRHVTVALLILL